MAITVTTNTPDEAAQQGAWSVQGTSADASGCEELKAAPGAGISHYLDSIVLTAAASINVTIGAGEAAGAVETTVFGPVYLSANVPFVYVFRRPLKLTANKSLTVDASGAGNLTVVAEGYTK